MKKILQIFGSLTGGAALILLLTYCSASFKTISTQDFKITWYNYPLAKFHLKSSLLKEAKASYEKSADALAKKQEAYGEVWKENEVFSRYLKFKASADSVKPKKEIVYVERVASCYIMNDPAFYKRQMNGSVITEKGKGSENEEVYVVRLSDGKIIKANLKTNSQWMGVKVGEKVQRVRGKRIVCTNHDSYWNIIQHMSVQDYTDYFPLY